MKKSMRVTAGVEGKSKTTTEGKPSNRAKARGLILKSGELLVISSYTPAPARSQPNAACPILPRKTSPLHQ